MIDILECGFFTDRGLFLPAARTSIFDENACRVLDTTLTFSGFAKTNQITSDLLLFSLFRLGKIPSLLDINEGGRFFRSCIKITGLARFDGTSPGGIHSYYIDDEVITTLSTSREEAQRNGEELVSSQRIFKSLIMGIHIGMIEGASKIFQELNIDPGSF